MTPTRTVVTVLGKDRSRIVATIATTLADCGANIDDIQQNVLNDIFSMTMLVTLDEDVATFNEVQELLARDGKALNLQVVIQREDVFEFMYNV
ncbi:MAG: ACT domain-containing protein [Coriobacteriales bacterium]